MSPTLHKGLGLRLLLRNFGKTIGHHVWAALLQLAAVILVARAYGPHGNGIYSVALLLPSLLAMLLALGIGPANVFYLASKRSCLRAVTAATFRLWQILSIVGLGIGSVAVFFFGEAWFPGVSPTALFLALIAFPAVLFNSLIGSIFQGVEDFSGLNLSLALHPLLCVIGIAVCVIAGLGADFALLAYSLGGAASALALWGRLRRLVASASPAPGAPYELRGVLAYGIKSHIGAIVAFLNLRIGLFQLNLLTTPAVAGVYTIAAQLGERMWILAIAVSTVLVPRLSSISDDPQRSAALLAAVARTTMLATLLLIISAAVFGPFAINLLFGRAYASAYIPFLLILPGILAASSARVLSTEFSARGRPEINTYMALAVLAINVPCNALLIPRFGAAGAAASATIAYIINLAVRVSVYRRFTGQAASSVLIPRLSDISALLEFVRGRRRNV